MSYSYLIFMVKMESVTKITIFGPEMIVKSGLKKFVFFANNVNFKYIQIPFLPWKQFMKNSYIVC